MKILVVNGSPAGNTSITLQTVEYLKIFFPEHEYETINVGQRIKAIEKDFSASKAALEAADLILFAYPVYTFLVPAQLHRFIELIKESKADIAGKYATQISTSKHFYDTTAHRFIEDNCADLGIKYLRGLSADMDDILTEQGQKDAREFFRFVLWNIGKGYFEKPSAQPETAVFEPVIASEESAFGPAVASEKTEVVGVLSSDAEVADAKSIRAALVSDYDIQNPAPGLIAMIKRFRKSFPGEIELVNLREFPFSGGCLGCFNCASDGKCIYKDGFDDYLRQHINSADAVVYAFTIKDHSMGQRFKMYDDRQFCNGHRTVTMGKPVAYMIDGKFSAEENVRTLIESRAQVGGNYLAGIATDEADLCSRGSQSSESGRQVSQPADTDCQTVQTAEACSRTVQPADTDRQIDQMIETLVYAVQNNYTQPKNFYGVGGLKIFRDLIYQMQGLMKEDHRFYKKHGFYNDFPQKKKGRIVGMYLVGAMMKNKKLSKKFSMTDGMMMSYNKMLEKARAEKAKAQKG